MADKRCASSGDDPRTPSQWLNRETADRLLRGESPDIADLAAREQAERLAKVLDTLAVDATPAGAGLRGEEAALAAFRKARDARPADKADRTDKGVTGRRAVGGLIRIGGPASAGRRARRPGWARPARLALAAALVAGTVGGVAAAAGSGVLPTPFGGGRPAPAATVSAAGPADRPLGSPSRESVLGGTTGLPAPAATPSGVPGSSASGTEGKGTGTPQDNGGDGGDGKSADQRGTDDSTGRPNTTSTWWKSMASACRDVRDGRTLGSDRRHTLEGAAGGSTRVRKYCERILETVGGTEDDGDGQGDDQEHGGHGKGRDGHHGRSHSGGGGWSRGDDGGNDHHQDGGIVLPIPSPSIQQVTPLVPTPVKSAL